MVYHMHRSTLLRVLLKISRNCHLEVEIHGKKNITIQNIRTYIYIKCSLTYILIVIYTEYFNTHAQQDRLL